MLVQNLGVKAGAFLRGKRVQIAADCIHLRSDLGRSAPLSSLEQHMFNEVRCAGLRSAFANGAGVDPHAH